MPESLQRDFLDEAVVLTEARPGARQKLLAFWVIPAFLVVALALVRPFSALPLRPIPMIVPFDVTLLVVTDLVTAIILFAQFSVLRTRALLIIANGYLYAALMQVPYVLAFPGLFAPDRALIGGLQSTAWLYILRHCGLAASMVAFAISGRGAQSGPRRDEHLLAIPHSIAATTLIVLALGVLCIAGDSVLPKATIDSTHFSPYWFLYAGAPMGALYTLAAILLWPQRETVLGLWLMVVAVVHASGIPMGFFPSPSRFSLGWYAVVCINLVANSLVLIILMAEVSNLYGRVLRAVRAQQQERQARLATGEAVAAMIAHEVNQPLAAMIIRASTIQRRLERRSPDLKRAIEDIQRIAADGHRAADIIQSIRANFQPDSRARTSVDINRLVTETVSLLRANLQNRGVRLHVELCAGPCVATGDRTQLQQVLFNLITNAADATLSSDGERLVSVSPRRLEDGSIIVSVADTGPGIAPGDVENVFTPLFTTKPTGMGMGLAICRSIVEAHDGRIWVTPNIPTGAVFQFSLAVSAFE